MFKSYGTYISDITNKIKTLADCRVIQQHMLIGPGVGATTSTGAKRLLREVIYYKRNPHPEVEIYPSEDR